MRDKVGKEELLTLLHSWLSVDSEITSSNNWFMWEDDNREVAVYVSQCKPSAFSKGNWYYEFFHTLSTKSMAKIMGNSCRVILIDYAMRRYTILEEDDIKWVYDNSSRVRKKGGLVTDFVVRVAEDQYYLEPSLAGTRLYRNIEVMEFQ